VFVVAALTVQFAPGNIGIGAASKVIVGVIFEITKLPADTPEAALKFVAAPQSAVIA
jgi:hypothetical protein